MKKFAVILALIVGGNLLHAQTEKINWLTITEALSKNQNSPKKIIVDVYTDWCGWCKVMDKSTFNDPAIIKYVNENFYMVKLNAEQKEDITLGEQTYKFIDNGSKGYHELAAMLLNGKMGYPSTVFIDENAAVLHVQSGYLKPTQFDTFIKYFNEDHYKSKDFQEFASNFESKAVDPK